MTKFFDTTTPVTTIALSDDRKGELVFTVSNATAASIRGESIVIPGPGAQLDWFTVDRPIRTYQRGQANQVAVAIAVPMAAPSAAYSFRLRTLVGGGVPEEDFDDSPSVSFDVTEPPPPIDTPPPKKPFPWWILIVIGAVVIGLIVIGAIVFFVTRKDGPDLTVQGVTREAGKFTVQVRNGGDDSAGPFTNRFQLSLPTEVVPPWLVDWPVQRIDAGATVSMTWDWPILATLAVVIDVTVDTAKEVAETNENNNAFQQTFPVPTPTPT